MQLLENLEPAPRVARPTTVQPSVEFDGVEGTAVTPGYADAPENFDDFLEHAGIDPAGIDVIPPVRTSRWQQQKDGELVWLTSYRFTFRRKTADIDLPLLFREADKKIKPRKQTDTTDTALVVAWSDLQVGKVDYRGDSDSLLQRVADTQQALIDLVKQTKPDRLIFADLGDTVENFDNTNREQQAITNDLSIMEQVDLATTLAWRTLRTLAERIPQVTYASVGSNHCQWRRNGKTIGRPTDDWGVFIGRQIARLAAETGADNIRFVEPQSHDESLAIDVFDDQYHVLGIVHGHQANRATALEQWWRNQSFGAQPVADASLLLHGHFHHLRVTELGSTPYGASRFIVGAPTIDNGSNWYKLRSGQDSVPGLAVLTLEKQKPFTGTVAKL